MWTALLMIIVRIRVVRIEPEFQPRDQDSEHQIDTTGQPNHRPGPFLLSKIAVSSLPGPNKCVVFYRSH